MRSLAIATVASLALVAGCQSPSFDAQDPAAISAIDSIVQGMMDGARAVDADRVLGATAPDVSFITGDVMLTGLESLDASFTNTYAALASQDHVVLNRQVRLIGPDVALVTAVGEGTYTDRAGWTSDPVGLGMTLVFVREQGQWQLKHAHQSIAF